MWQRLESTPQGICPNEQTWKRTLSTSFLFSFDEIHLLVSGNMSETTAGRMDGHLTTVEERHVITIKAHSAQVHKNWTINFV